jgi:hypothetical protein
MKFTEWRSWSFTPMALVSLGSVGTSAHTLKVTFQGNEIIVYYDGAKVVDMFDTGFEGVPPFLSGGAGVHMYMEPAFVSTFDDFSVTPVRPAPVATNDAYTAVQNHTLIVPAPGVLTNDLPGPGQYLAAVLVSGSAHGSVTLNTNGGFTYTPATNYLGTDSFTYKDVDGVTNSATATVTLTVVTNNPPVVVNDSYDYWVNTTLTVGAPGILSNDSDPNGDPLTAAVASAPAHGSLTLNADGSFAYTPATNFAGADSFTYRAYDGSAYSSTGMVALNLALTTR